MTGECVTAAVAGSAPTRQRFVALNLRVRARFYETNMADVGYSDLIVESTIPSNLQLRLMLRLWCRTGTLYQLRLVFAPPVLPWYTVQ